MLNKAITEDIKHTGWVIRDWLAPFYTLGGAVAFVIAMLTLLDQDGKLHLTRIVGAVLAIFTFVAWALHLYKSRNMPSQSEEEAGTTNPLQPRVKLHVILFTISCFFIVGILISEAWMKARRTGVPEMPSTVQTDKTAFPAVPATQVTMPPPAVASSTAATAVHRPAEPLAPAPATPLVHAPPSSSEATPLPAAALAVAAPSAAASAAFPHSEDKPVLAQPKPAASTAPAAAKSQPKVQTVTQTQKSPTVPSSSTSTTTKKASEPKVTRKASEYPEKCASLLRKFSLGEEVSPQEHRYLETSCR